MSAAVGLIELFKQVVERLRREQIQFAVAGGFAVSLYRLEKRTTEDLDFLILTADQSASTTQKQGERLINDFGLKPGIARQADLEGGPMVAIKKKSTPPYMLVGRNVDDKRAAGLDFILPAIPWFAEALRRAQHNLIDFGFAKVPTLTVEDVLLSKFLACKNDAKRFKDLDDLQSIFRNRKNALDANYLCAEMLRLKLPVPKAVRDEAPEALRKVSKSLKH